jgi:hypothetical protein
VLCKIVLENSFFLTNIWAHRIFCKGFVAKNNTTFWLKDVKELTYTAFGKITKDVWTIWKMFLNDILVPYSCRRRRRKLTLFHKIHNNIAPEYLQDYLNNFLRTNICLVAFWHILFICSAHLPLLDMVTLKCLWLSTWFKLSELNFRFIGFIDKHGCTYWLIKLNIWLFHFGKT